MHLLQRRRLVVRLSLVVRIDNSWVQSPDFIWRFINSELAVTIWFATLLLEDWLGQLGELVLIELDGGRIDELA